MHRRCIESPKSACFNGRESPFAFKPITVHFGRLLARSRKAVFRSGNVRKGLQTLAVSHSCAAVTARGTVPGLSDFVSSTGTAAVWRRAACENAQINREKRTENGRMP